jgi:hypothetical protein
MYVDPVAYKEVEAGGVICAIIMLVIMVFTILFRDILKIWTCGGLTEAHNVVVPDRQLTTMSAAWAPETMPQLVSNEVKN